MSANPIRVSRRSSPIPLFPSWLISKPKNTVRTHIAPGAPYHVFAGQQLSLVKHERAIGSDSPSAPTPTPGQTQSMRIRGSVALLAIFASCSTPQSVIDKSKASTELYAKVDAAYKMLHEAIDKSLRRKGQLESIRKTGPEQPALYSILPGDQPKQAPTQTVAAVQGFRYHVQTSRRLHGIVDRFVRIKVWDPSDVAEVTDAGKKLFPEDK